MRACRTKKDFWTKEAEHFLGKWGEFMYANRYRLGRGYPKKSSFAEERTDPEFENNETPDDVKMIMDIISPFPHRWKQILDLRFVENKPNVKAYKEADLTLEKYRVELKLVVERVAGGLVFYRV